MKYHICNTMICQKVSYCDFTICIDVGHFHNLHWCGATSTICSDVGHFHNLHWCGPLPQFALMWATSTICIDVGHFHNLHWCGPLPQFAVMWATSTIIYQKVNYCDLQWCEPPIFPVIATVCQPWAIYSGDCALYFTIFKYLLFKLKCIA